MLAWLARDLAANRAKWTIAVFHHPPYSDGSHVSDTEDRMVQVREHVVPILERYGVDLVLSGHSHGYERTALVTGAWETPTVADAPLNPTAWWNTLQDQFTKIAASAAVTPPPKKAVARSQRPRAAKPAKSG